MASSQLYGISDFQTQGAEVLAADKLAMDGGDLIAPAVLPRVSAGARPVSPSTIEKSASLLRSLSMAATRPAKGETPENRSRIFAGVARGLRTELQGDQMARLRTAAPELGPRLQAALLAACGALLGAQDFDAGFEWAGNELDELAKHVPAATSAVFPGAYYHEIFSADVQELTRSLGHRRREEALRRKLQTDVLAVIAREGVGAPEVHGAGRAAMDAGLGAEATAAKAVGELIEREVQSRRAHEIAATEAREARRAAKEAEANTAREARALAEEKQRRQQASDELNAVKAALALEEETRRKVEQAQIRVMSELKEKEEARWTAVQELAEETKRCREFELAAKNAEEEMRDRVEAAEARELKFEAEAKRASKQYVEAEKMRVALEGRVSALDDVKVRIEKQLALEREACAVELGLRQKAEAAYADAQKSAADAQTQAAEATQKMEVAQGALDVANTELAACEERLRVANDGSLDQQMSASAAEEAVKQLKALREEDQAKMHRIITERAALQQKLDDTDARLVSVQAAAEKAEAAQAKQRYELHAQLTEVHRRCEDLKAESTKNELLLQHERETGLTASDHEKRLTMQLDVERREKQALQQQLAAEAALRQKSDAQGQASSKEVQARLREVDLGAQRLQSVQAELHRSREEARQAREQLADAHARAAKMERERDAALEDGRRERLRRGELEHKAPPMERGAPQPIQVRTSGGFPKPSPFGSASVGHAFGNGPSLQQHLPMPNQGSVLQQPIAQHPSRTENTISDELSRSDLWNFSNGAMSRGPPILNQIGRSGSVGGVDATLPRIKSPFTTAANQNVLKNTSLDPEAARQLYGATAVGGLGEDD